MDPTVVAALIGLAGVITGSLLTPLISSIMERSRLKQVTAAKDLLEASYRQLERNHRDLLEKELSKRTSRRFISFQLLLLDSYLLRDRMEGRAPTLEILGINALGPIHQGRELIRDILTGNQQIPSGKVRILLLDPNCGACVARLAFEGDTVGRLGAEINASLYILADIRALVGTAAFANLEIRVHDSDPDRSLIMLDVGASLLDGNRAPEEIVAAYPEGLILENPYPRRRGERGMEGESCSYTPRRGGGENEYLDNISYFRRLWSSAQPIVIPESPYALSAASTPN